MSHLRYIVRHISTEEKSSPLWANPNALPWLIEDTVEGYVSWTYSTKAEASKIAHEYNQEEDEQDL